MKGTKSSFPIKVKKLKSGFGVALFFNITKSSVFGKSYVFPNAQP